ncbi:MAG: 50S ribosomal protein L9 [Omnitrophica bacterium RIFCSPHIGHO2_02_FULL_46_11]|nr:MAG: 50S ribosomal protein L9 [Omnitrophica bacterium RIFCSPHIGHO2_02_FULL_46_11]OGW87910.1 MAG: 50S ribosomal protein L9 [Omnitrophica bacterium RIFCSPLOWO2_01_FULL_45_10b]
MEIILVQDVDSLGKAGDRVKVRDGFSRNYLIPRRLAVPASEGGLKFLEAKKKRAEEKRLQEKEQTSQLAEKIKNWTCVLKVKVGPEGKLFGSVTRQDIHNALQKEGFEIDKRKIELHEPIHQVGEYGVRIRLHPEVEFQLKVIVTQA